MVSKLMLLPLFLFGETCDHFVTTFFRGGYKSGKKWLYFTGEMCFNLYIVTINDKQDTFCGVMMLGEGHSFEGVEFST